MLKVVHNYSIVIGLLEVPEETEQLTLIAWVSEVSQDNDFVTLGFCQQQKNDSKCKTATLITNLNNLI